MGVRTWSYEPEKCDGDYCPCDCDNCPKAYDGEHIPFNALIKALVKGDEKSNDVGQNVKSV